MPVLSTLAAPSDYGRNGEAMSETRPNRSLMKVVLTDLQFWVPVVVLAGGLLVLRWIS